MADSSVKLQDFLHSAHLHFGQFERSWIKSTSDELTTRKRTSSKLLLTKIRLQTPEATIRQVEFILYESTRVRRRGGDGAGANY